MGNLSMYYTLTTREAHGYARTLRNLIDHTRRLIDVARKSKRITPSERAVTLASYHEEIEALQLAAHFLENGEGSVRFTINSALNSPTNPTLVEEKP